MLEKLRSFYYDIDKIARGMKQFPDYICNVVYDPRYTPESTIEDIKEWEEDYYGDGCFQLVFDELSNYIYNYRTSIDYICESVELDEELTVFGDYDYITGLIDDNTPFIYMQPQHYRAFPERCFIYGERFRFDFSTDIATIYVTESVKSVRELFFIRNTNTRINKLKDFLYNTDRPPVWF